MCSVLAQEDKRREPPIVIPPLVVPVDVEVQKGGRVVIDLQPQLTRESSTRVLLRSQPVHGTLRELAAEEPGMLRVEYRHNPTSTATEDSFLYAARSRNSAVSSPAIVRIRIVEAPARLHVADEIRMPEVFPQKSSSAALILRNAGGGVLRGRFTVPSPWHVDEPAEFAIPSGQTREFTLHFSPPSVGRYHEAIVFSDNLAPNLILKGECLPPYHIAPEQREAALLGLQRELTFTLHNRTGAVLPLQATGPDEMDIDAPTEFENNATIRIKNKSQREVTGRLQLATPGHVEHIVVRLAATPAHIEAHPPHGLVFPGDTAPKQLTLRNTGGTSTALQFQISGAFTVSKTAVEIPPESEVDVKVQPQHTSPQSGLLRIVGAGSSLQLPLRVTVPAQDRAAASTQKPPGIRNPAPLPATESRPNQIRRPRDNRTTAVSELQAIHLAPRTITLAWTPSVDSTATPSLEIRQFKPSSDGKLMMGWGPWMDARMETRENQIFFTVPGVPPDTSFVVRARRGEEFSRELLVSTPPVPPRAFPWGSVLLLIALVFLGSLAWRGYRSSMPTGQ